MTKAKQVSRVLTLHKKKGNTRKYTNICLFVQKKFQKDKSEIKVIDSLEGEGGKRIAKWEGMGTE